MKKDLRFPGLVHFGDWEGSASTDLERSKTRVLTISTGIGFKALKFVKSGQLRASDLVVTIGAQGRGYGEMVGKGRYSLVQKRKDRA